MLLHAADERLQVGTHGLALVGRVDPPGVAAQLVGLLQESGLEPLLRQAERRVHAGRPAADHERPGDDVDLATGDRHAQRGLRDGHPHLVLGLGGRPLRFALVHPGVLVADVGHLDQVGVERGLAQRVLEERFVGARRAGGDHDPVQPVLGDFLAHELLGVGRAAEEVVLRERHPRQRAGVLHDLVHVDDAGDVDAAGAHEDPDARRFAAQAALGRIGARARELAAGRDQGRGRFAGRGRGFGDRARDGLGGLEGAGHEDAGAVGRHRREVRGAREAVLVEVELEDLRQLLSVARGLEADRQHRQVEVLDLDLARVGRVAHRHPVVAGARLDRVRAGAHEAHALVLGPLVKPVEILAVAADVHEEEGLLQTAAGGVLGGHERLLDRVHAAHARAVAVLALVGVARAHALDPRDAPGLGVVRWPHQMPHPRPARREQPLVLEAGDDVRDALVAVEVEPRRVEGFEARSEDHRADGERRQLLLLLEVDRGGRAELLAGFALAAEEVDAGLAVDRVLQRHGLTVLDVGRRAVVQTEVELVTDLAGAFLGAEAAGNALVHVDVAGFFLDGDGEVADVTGDVDDFRESEQLHIQVPADLDQFGGDDSHRAVVGREGLVQLGHHPADPRAFLHQVHEVTRVGEVKGRLHAGDPPANHQYRTDGLA